MFTIPTTNSSFQQQGIHEEDHPLWTKAFKSDVRLQQLAEDDFAWSSVTGTLVTIVSIGAVLAVISVTMCLWH